MAAPITQTRTIVSTTLPEVEDNLPTLYSDRLMIRPLLLPDLDKFHTLRSQPETMAYSLKGIPDKNMDETEVELKCLQSPYRDSHVYFGIFLKDNPENELIGEGGVRKFVSYQTGWPEFQCIIKNERWNLEYELEFAVTFFKFWWSLRRKKVEIPVVLDPEFADAQVADTNKVKELVYFCSILNRGR